MKLAFRLLLILLPLGGMAQTPQDSLRVLWVGNSFSYCNDLPGMVQKIASTQKVKLSCTRFLKGGERFSGHLKNKKLLQGHCRRRLGLRRPAGAERGSRDADRTGGPRGLSRGRTLDSLVHAASPDARVIFYMTWGHKYGNRKPVAEYPLSNGYEGMQERLKTSYLEMAYDNGAWCAPVGMAWRTVRSERPDCILYRPDCYHPAVPGSYLAANVIFTTILQRPYQTAFTAELPAEQAEYLQRTAQRTVLDNLVLLNIR